MAKRHLIFRMIRAVGIFAGFYFCYEIRYSFIGSEYKAPFVQTFRSGKAALRVFNFLRDHGSVRIVILNRVYYWFGRERKRKLLNLISRHNAE